MTALSVVQDACGSMSLDIPLALFSSTNTLDQQMAKLLNEEVLALSKRCAWTRLTKEKTFTTVAQAAQTGAVPSDFDWYVNDTMFNRTESERIAGPITADQWQMEQAYTASPSALNPLFRFRGGSILLTPTPTAGQTCAYEYVTKYRVADVAGNEDQEKYVADDDYALLDEGLVKLGLIWRWKKSHGFDYAEDYAEYERSVDVAISRDGGARTLNMTSGTKSILSVNIPEGSWS